MKTVRVGVIGVGHIGRHHARILADLPGVELVGIVDVNEAHASALAREYNTAAFTNTTSLVGKVDAVTVAVPTIYHFPTASEFLRRGIAVLVEKPLAFSTNEAREMVRLASQNNAILQVGHVERFNPAWQYLETRLEAPTFIEAKRFSEYPFRSIDVSVVFDLMIHDLDLVLQMVDSPVAEVDAVGSAIFSPTIDQAEARIWFENGCQAVVSASRVHDHPIRRIRFWGDHQQGEVDLFRRTTSLRYPDASLMQNLPSDLAPDERKQLLGKLFHTEMQSLDRTAEPLRAELESFVQCVREASVPRVTGERGCELVSLATRIESAIRNHHSASLKVLRKSA